MLDPKKIESIISQISGINGVKVVADEEGIKEIHVITDSQKNPKQVVRDVETAIFASTGIKIDRKIISVAQLSSPGQSFVDYEISSLRTEDLGKKIKVEVTIERAGEVYTGSAEGAKTSIQKLKTAAEAVINALDELSDSIFSVDDLRIITLAGKEFLVCHLTKLQNGLEKSVIGSCEIQKDPLIAAAYAALDAFKRS
ncbi:hypothetical protein [Pseudothermotoga thermarum]|uniref:Uncharacterized protein n=1 Tax=Pseudothermotoga thermarum DSM 5069 TaxID=688269 RepID=F7YXT0_9THEM|nr:hypothetical protein [Pseudothermotoga thermarum]AEH50724.1 hypothetical protein Theth_0637 [Pseudothermotoga thermarum DSM 5069]